MVFSGSGLSWTKLFDIDIIIEDYMNIKTNYNLASNPHWSGTEYLTSITLVSLKRLKYYYKISSVPHCDKFMNGLFSFQW